MKIFGKGFNYSQDGPGNRLVYHLSGCNMKCIWCSNPEGMSLNAGKDVPVEVIVKEALRCKPMFFSGGGVTFTGGEATIQFDDLRLALNLLHKSQIHTALETNGTSPNLSLLYDDLDYLIMDFKHFDSHKLKEYTGSSNECIKNNYEMNCQTGRQQHIRIPLIKNITAVEPERYAEYFSGFNTSKTVFEFLPYHEYGKDKWTQEYTVVDGFIDDNTLSYFTDVFHSYGLSVVNT